MTEQEVEELAVLGDTKGRPAPARDSIRPVAPPPSRAAVAQDDLFAAAARAGSATEPTPAEKPGEVRHEIRMNVGKEFMGFLEDVRAQLSNAHPGASLEVVFLECMKAALGVWRRRSRGETGRPRATAKGAKGRNVAAGVRRNVWRRDGGRCTFVSEDGRRCTATHRLQLHHVIPFACGGAASEDNIRLLCSLHNDLMARVDFGDGHMDRFTGRTRAVAG